MIERNNIFGRGDAVYFRGVLGVIVVINGRYKNGKEAKDLYDISAPGEYIMNVSSKLIITRKILLTERLIK